MKKSNLLMIVGSLGVSVAGALGDFPNEVPGAVVSKRGDESIRTEVVHLRQKHYVTPDTAEKLCRGDKGKAFEMYEEINENQGRIYRALLDLVENHGLEAVRVEMIPVENPIRTRSHAFGIYSIFLEDLTDDYFDKESVSDYLKAMRLKYFGFEERDVEFGERILDERCQEFEEFRYIPGAAFLLMTEGKLKILPLETDEIISRSLDVMRRTGKSQNHITYDGRENVWIDVLSSGGFKHNIFLAGYQHALGGSEFCGGEDDMTGRFSLEDNIATYNSLSPHPIRLTEVNFD